MGGKRLIVMVTIGGLRGPAFLLAALMAIIGRVHAQTNLKLDSIAQQRLGVPLGQLSVVITARNPRF